MPGEAHVVPTVSNEPRRLTPVLIDMENLKLELGDGEVLLTICSVRASISHTIAAGCWPAQAAASIREGLEHLMAPSNDELDLLDRADSMASNERLACQVRGAGELVVELPRSEAPVHEIERPVSISARAAKHLAAQLVKHPGRSGRAPRSASVRLFWLLLSRGPDRCCTRRRQSLQQRRRTHRGRRRKPALRSGHHARCRGRGVVAAFALRQPQCEADLRLR